MSKILITGGFNNNIDSAWKAAEASNAKKETKTGWGTTWTPGICRDSASWQGMGQRRSKIQSHSGSRGRNGIQILKVPSDSVIISFLKAATILIIVILYGLKCTIASAHTS